MGNLQRMQAFRYHGALDSLEEACFLCSGPVFFFRNRLGGAGGRGGRSISDIFSKVSILFRHFLLMLKLRKEKGSLGIVREFSTIPLLLVKDLLGRRKKDFLFIINHNVQWAVNSPLERMALAKLVDSGIRFIFLERSDFDEYNNMGLQSRLHITIPHPVGGGLTVPVPVKRNRPLVGIVGEYRKEKGIDRILSGVSGEQEFDLVLGFPCPESFLNESEHAGGEWEVRNTSVYGDYLSLIEECDILLICATEAGYKYRASGLIADSIGMGTMVLGPDFPLIRHQINWPIPVGECYESISDINNHVMSMVRNRVAYENAFDNYRSARSSEMIAKVLSEGGLHG